MKINIKIIGRTMNDSRWHQWRILGNERKFDPVDLRNIQNLQYNDLYLFCMSRPITVPAVAVSPYGQRYRSLIGIKRDKMVFD